jgi:anti-sigma regulatory factor (Ser/Thr protein kinase)
MNKRIPEKKIRDFIFNNIEQNPSTITKLTSEKFGISRQVVNYHLKKLEKEALISSTGITRNKKFFVKPTHEFGFELDIISGLEEHKVWKERVEPLLKEFKGNIVSICNYGFTEMFNNVIDHSEGSNVVVGVKVFPNKIEMIVNDDGVGIFNKIAREFHLDDQRHAILELSKGKLTTDPKRHSGEGIFFSSRMFDEFEILSGKFYFSSSAGIDWLHNREKEVAGTAVFMSLNTNTSRTMKEVFDRFATGEDYGFTKTHIPVSLLKYGEENLISRSQAKRLLAGLQKFKEVILDFKGINSIGQAFADEIFRVFRNEYPDIRLIPVNTVDEVKKMISRAESHIS